MPPRERGADEGFNTTAGFLARFVEPLLGGGPVEVEAPLSSHDREQMLGDGAPLLDPGFLHLRLRRALKAREGLAGSDTDALRLVHAESDGLPGLIVDRYGEVLVLQALTTGSEHWKRRSLHTGLVPLAGRRLRRFGFGQLPR